MQLQGDEVDVSRTLAQAYEDAFRDASTGQLTERWVRLADKTVRLRIASESLVRLVDALGHLEIPTAEAADLEISVWDGTVGPAPPFPDSGVPDAPNGLRVMWTEGSVRACHQPGQATISALDAEKGSAWFWCRDGRDLPYWEFAAPFRMILSWWLAGVGANLVHAAAVGEEDGGLLIVGRGGSGKSTTALLSLLAGLKYASDDYVVVARQRNGDGPYVHSIYGSGKLDNEQAARFPQLERAIVNPSRTGDEKAVFLVNRFAPDRMTMGFPLLGVLVPRISGRPHTEVRRASPIAALSALAPSTIFQLPGDAAGGLADMSALVRTLPCLEVLLGTDFEQIPRTLSETISSLLPAAGRGR